jgi:hypothetical protein
MIHKSDKDLYINFNYTATLENVYGISDASVIHIHGSLRGQIILFGDMAIWAE